jgi:uncharacterized membrane protein YjjP (DUF1212 family)
VESGPKRRRAIIVLLLMVVVAAASVEVTLYLQDKPTCEAVRSGSTPLTADRKCFDGSSDRKTVVEALAAVAALAALGGAFAWWRVLERDGDQRQAAMIASVALILGGVALLLGSI